MTEDASSAVGVSAHPKGCAIVVAVVPRSSRTGIDLAPDGGLRVRVTASPIDGAANAAVLRVLAEAIGVSPSTLEIVSGAAARRKRILARGIAVAEVERRLRSRIDAPG